MIEWYRQRGGRLEQTTLYGMSQDNPEVTPLRLCRFDWCLTVPVTWEAEEGVNVQDFPAWQVASIRCLGGIMQEYKALQYLFRYWLPRSRYQPANLPGMEIYRRQPIELGWETFDIDCAIPMKAKGMEFITEADEGTKGPAYIMLMDPDGNPILVDQHV